MVVGQDKAVVVVATRVVVQTGSAHLLSFAKCTNEKVLKSKPWVCGILCMSGALRSTSQALSHIDIVLEDQGLQDLHCTILKTIDFGSVVESEL